MKKFLLIPDSFKGTASSGKICGIMERAIRSHFPEAEIISIPVADGGEGSVDAFLSAIGGEKRLVRVEGPYFEDMEAFYGVCDNGGTAVIEMAAAAGLPLVGDRRDPTETTTYGVGRLMKHAISQGAKKMIMGLGGSATNDGGCGAAAAMGVRFFDREGNGFIPVGGTLKDIARIDMSGLSLGGAEVVTMCDIDNPLYGESGAAHVFAPQKGADAKTVEALDGGLRHLARIVERDMGLDSAALPGAGAAGGMGYGMAVFFGSKLQMGIETVLDTVRFDELLENANLVISGEGRMDTQSLRGKVVIGVARRASAANVPLVAIVGDIGDGIEQAYDMGVSAVFSTNRVAVDFKYAKQRAESDLFLTADNLMRFIKRMECKWAK